MERGCKFMLTGIREKTIVKEGGKVEIPQTDLPVGKEVEVIILSEDEEMDATDYLLSTEANRRYMDDALEELKHPERFIQVDLDRL